MEQKDRRGEIQLHVRIGPLRQRQAGGCRSAGSHERAGAGAGSGGGSTAQPGRQRLFLVPHNVTHEQRIGKRDENK